MKYTSIFAKPFLKGETKMKKNISLLISVTLLATILFSCASLPEPSEKNNNLICGNIAYDFKCIPNKYGFPEKFTKTNGIEIQIQNLDTKKTYTMTSKSNGDFSKAGLSKGVYKIIKIKKELKLENGYEQLIEVDLRDKSWNTFEFIPMEYSVINLGKIILDIDVTSIDINYFYYKYSVSWNTGFDKVYNSFLDKNIESSWLNYKWLTPGQSLQTYDQMSEE